jgi:leucyl/phenylalanyl-tRNA--protein transferase
MDHYTIPPVDNIFPHPELADEEGFLAAGGDLEIQTLLMAYSRGIFPWYSEDTPILWWSPDPRMVLFPDNLKVSKSLRQLIKKKSYNVTFDNDFTSVIHHCARVPRKDQPGTWLTGEMQGAYIALYDVGFAHSVEVYLNNKLAGGLYGVALGKAFFGESMFHLERDASKVALYYLVQKLLEWDFDFIDVQVSSSHMYNLGAREIPRPDFLNMLSKSIMKEGHYGPWNTSQ